MLLIGCGHFVSVYIRITGTFKFVFFFLRFWNIHGLINIAVHERWIFECLKEFSHLELKKIYLYSAAAFIWKKSWLIYLVMLYPF